MSKANETKGGFCPSDAVAETMKLYHAWLGYLLTRQGVDTLRVKAEDIRAALGTLSCTVTREEDEYVIRLSGKEARDHGE